MDARPGMQVGGRHVPVRRLAALAGYLAAGVALLFVVWPGARTTQRPAAGVTSPAVSATLAFPSPPAGAVVFAREAGPNVLALAVDRNSTRMKLQVSVVGAQGTGVGGLHVELGGSAAEPCGAGCYRAVVASSPTIRVVVRGLGMPVAWRVKAPVRTAPASAIVRRAGVAWRSLSSVGWHEILGSDRSHVVRSDWRAVAPNAIAYEIAGGGASVVIGHARWDRRTAAGRWLRSVQDPAVHQPVPFWASAANAHVIGAMKRNGRGLWVVSFYDPRTPGWFRLEIDRASFRTMRMDMFAAAHFMHDAYSGFDAVSVSAPAGVG